MNAIVLLLSIPGHPCATFAPSTWERFHLVEELSSSNQLDRSRAELTLLLYPPSDAYLAVVWGSTHANKHIAMVCSAVLDEWDCQKQDRHWRRIVTGVHNDYDRFLNSFLEPVTPKNFLVDFEKAAESGRAFGRLVAD